MLTKHEPKPVGSAKGLRFAISAACYNETLADGLVSHCVECLVSAGASRRGIRVLRVPGSFEVTAGAARLARSGRYDCVIGLGVLLEGQTRHAELIGSAVAQGLTQLAIETGVPTIFGIVTANNIAQARVRCLGKKHNRGREAAVAAIAMARAWKEKP